MTGVQTCALPIFRAVDVLKPSDTTETLQPTRVRLYLTELETESLDLLFIAVTSQRDLYMAIGKSTAHRR